MAKRSHQEQSYGQFFESLLQQQQAKINFGAGINDARGKVNGNVLSRNTFGAYIRRKVTPVNTRTPAQTAVRSTFAALSKAWSGTLTDDERAAWIAFAASNPRVDVFGDSIVITGLNMFVSLNTRLTQAGVAIITTPPVSLAVDAVPWNNLALEPDSVGFDQTALASVDTLFYYVFMTPPLAPGKVAQQSDFRFIAAAAWTITGSVPHTEDISALYIAKYGAPITGKKVAVLISTLDTLTGGITPGVKAIATVAS